MAFKKWVLNIQPAGYNGVRTAYGTQQVCHVGTKDVEIQIFHEQLKTMGRKIMYYVGYAGWTAVAAPAGYQSTLP